MILLLCYCECFELCVTSVTAVTRHNIFVFPPRKYIVHQMCDEAVEPTQIKVLIFKMANLIYSNFKRSVIKNYNEN